MRNRPVPSGLVTRDQFSTKRTSQWPRSIAAAMRRLNDLRARNALPLVLRGRSFTYRDLQIVIAYAAVHYEDGRTRIARVVCRQLNWRQPNGWLKDRACREVLIKLERLGLFALPPRLIRHSSTRKTAKQAARVFRLPPSTQESITSMPRRIEFILAKGDAKELLWNALVEKHHYLGYGVQVGRCLKYLIKGDGQLVGAISFSSPAWRLSLRSSLVRRLHLHVADAHDIIIYNSRFLLLPTVRVPHLASRVLAAALKKAVADWTRYYAVQPMLAETFVDPTRFSGTSYRAANWIRVGMTNGYSKVGSSHHNSQEPKEFFVYGLTRNLRRALPAAALALREH